MGRLRSAIVCAGPTSTKCWSDPWHESCSSLPRTFPDNAAQAVGRENRGGRCTGEGSTSTRWAGGSFPGSIGAPSRRESAGAAACFFRGTPSRYFSSGTSSRNFPNERDTRCTRPNASHVPWRSRILGGDQRNRAGCFNTAPLFALLRSSARKRGEKRGWRPAVLEEQGGILEDHMPGASSLERRKLRHRGDHARWNLDARSPLEL